MPSNIHHPVAGGRAWHRPLAAVALALPLALMPGTAMSQPAAPAAAKATYIVQFHDGVDARAEAAAGAGRGLAVTRVLTHVYPGMIATMNEAQAAALARNPRVVLVEKDQVVTASTTQAGATWGLDRIDQLNRPLSGSYSYETTGDGVTANVIDTGVLASHVTSRAGWPVGTTSSTTTQTPPTATGTAPTWRAPSADPRTGWPRT